MPAKSKTPARKSKDPCAELKRELKEAREQQAAVSDILRAISATAADVKPALRTIARHAMRLCQSVDARIWLVQGDRAKYLTGYGSIPPAKPGETVALDRTSGMGRAIVDRKAVHIKDAATASLRTFPMVRELQRRHGHRTLLSVPLMHEKRALGAITMRKMVVEPFTKRQIELVQTFANQAAIAIENVRLFKELQGRNAEITEALEQQTATAEILKVISSSPTDTQPVFDAIVKSGNRLFGGMIITLRLVTGDRTMPVASTLPLRMSDDTAALSSTDEGGPYTRAIVRREVVQVPDILAEEWVNDATKRRVKSRGFRASLSAPLLRENSAIGVINVMSTTPGSFTDKQIALLKTFADQAVIAIENVRLFNETKEALEQQTATAEILRVISSSPTEIQPVFDAILESATRLCEAHMANLLLHDGDTLLAVAQRGGSAEYAQWVMNRGPYRPVSGAMAHMLAEGRPVQVPDLMDSAGYRDRTPGAVALVKLAGARTSVLVPLLKEGRVVGGITIYRPEARPFSQKQIDLVSTFASQAVIAIENVRLFNETKEALEQQTVISEILRVIGSSPTDTQPVFDAIVKSGVHLFGGLDVSLRLVKGDQIFLIAATRPDWQSAGGIALNDYRLPQARAILHREIVQIVDGLNEDIPEVTRQRWEHRGIRALLIAPMVRGDEAIGTISVSRAMSGAFTDKEITLLKTFADQAVIAIENVRLFKELQQRNAEVTESLEQQTATAEILKVISSSPTDIQPVFDSILENATRLCGAHMANLRLYDGNRFANVAQRGVSPEYAKWVSDEAHKHSPQPDGGIGRMIAEKRPIHILDRRESSTYRNGSPTTVALVELGGARTFLAVPMLKEGQLIGGIGLFRPEVRAFTQKQIDLVSTFASQAVIAIQNVRLFKELQTRNTEVTESLEQQTATADILKVIASSPSNVQPVFDAILENACRLGDSQLAGVFRYDGTLLHIVATRNWPAEALASVSSRFPMLPDPRTASGRTVLTGEVVCLEDTLADATYDQSFAHAGGWRRMLGVPMMREGVSIGVIVVCWQEPGPIPQRQVTLLKTFADQAVIAIENVRLFNETKEALEQQTVTADILKVISSSPTDTQPVFDAIVKSGVRLFNGQDVALRLVKGDHRRPARNGGGPRMGDDRDHRHRHRPHARADGDVVSGLRAGRCLDHPQVWRHRAGACDQPALLPDDGGRYHGVERAGPGIDLYHPAAGRRRGRAARRDGWWRRRRYSTGRGILGDTHNIGGGR